MDSLELPAFLIDLPWGQIVIVGLLLLAIRYASGAGVLVVRRESENRKLRQAVNSYEAMEATHRELSAEVRERNRFQGDLPILIARLNEERTIPGIARLLTDFVSRNLEAAEASLFLVEGTELAAVDARGVQAKGLRIRIGEGLIGSVAQYKRVMGKAEVANLDPSSRQGVKRDTGRIDTVLAAPMVAHGKPIGVLNVGGKVGASGAVLREILTVVAQLGATALENQINFERLEREATTDGLTQLSNVRNFKDKARQELKRAARFGRPMSVFLFDIDHFKNYNDQNGHPEGDECLRITAEILRTNTRATDLPARYGGEEFIVLLPETDVAGALAFAEKIRETIAATAYPAGEKQPLGCVSVSGGVATFPRDGADLDALIAAADAALYTCKDAGRNRVAAPSSALAAPAD